MELIGCSWHAEAAGNGTLRITAPDLFFVQAYCETCVPPPTCLLAYLPAWLLDRQPPLL